MLALTRSIEVLKNKIDQAMLDSSMKYYSIQETCFGDAKEVKITSSSSMRQIDIASTAGRWFPKKFFFVIIEVPQKKNKSLSIYVNEVDVNF